MKIIISAVCIPLILGSAVYLAPRSPYAAARPLVIDEPTDGDVLKGTLLCGLTPEVLAVAGCDQSETSAVVGAIRSSEHLGAMLDAHRTVERTQVVLTGLAAQIHAAPFDESLRSSFSTANAEHEAATSAFGTARQELLADALSALGDEEEATIRTCLTSPEQGMPLEFRVATCSDVDWGEVSRALVAEARAERRDEELAPEYARLLANIRGRQEVVAAESRLAQTDLTSIQQVFKALRSE